MNGTGTFLVRMIETFFKQTRIINKTNMHNILLKAFIATIKKRQRDFLSETVNHFNNKNRSVIYGKHGDKKCLYVPIEGKSDGCAIGRHIADKKLCEKLDIEGEIGDSNAFCMLPDNLQELGEDFLSEVQTLHDTDINWNDNGISTLGQYQADSIKIRFDLV